MRGGARPGAGRKKGVPDKKTVALQTAAKEAGLMPLEYLLSVMRDEDAERAVRIDAAKAAARFVHPALASTQTFVSGTLTLEKLVEAAVNPE